jgi:hypothetical protein
VHEINLKFDGQDGIIAEFKSFGNKDLYLTKLNLKDPDMTKPKNVIGLIQRFKIEGYQVTLYVNPVDYSNDVKNVKQHIACGIGYMDNGIIQNRVMINALNIIYVK